MQNNVILHSQEKGFRLQDGSSRGSRHSEKERSRSERFLLLLLSLQLKKGGVTGSRKEEEEAQCWRLKSSDCYDFKISALDLEINQIIGLK